MLTRGHKPVPARDNPAKQFAHAPLTPSERRRAASLMRVNHAGEVAAQGLYHGQALAARSGEVARQMRESAAEEDIHLSWCRERLMALGAKPSVLDPAWYFGAYALGGVAAVAGDRVSLGFVAETERQVVEHLQRHIERLPAGDTASKAVLERMCEDEQRHADSARSLGARELPKAVRQGMRVVSKVMTTTAYWF